MKINFLNYKSLNINQRINLKGKSGNAIIFFHGTWYGCLGVAASYLNDIIEINKNFRKQLNQTK